MGDNRYSPNLAPENAHPLVIGAVRLGIGGLTLLLFVLLQGKFTFEKWPLKETLIASVSSGMLSAVFFLCSPNDRRSDWNGRCNRERAGIIWPVGMAVAEKKARRHMVDGNLFIYRWLSFTVCE